jgi:hypothetical protein
VAKVIARFKKAGIRVERRELKRRTDGAVYGDSFHVVDEHSGESMFIENTVKAALAIAKDVADQAEFEDAESDLTPSLDMGKVLRRPVELITFFTRHAMDRIREHHPRCGIAGAKDLLAAALEVPVEQLRPILLRKVEKNDVRYFLSRDRDGVFVIGQQRARGDTAERFPLVCITYLRLNDDVMARALKLWPKEAA